MATPLQEKLNALLALQQIDTQIYRAKKAQMALDNGTQAEQQAKAAHAEALSRREALHKSHADLKDSELKLDSIEAKRKTYQQRLYQGTITNARELANIEREIEALGRQRSDLDGKILTLMEQTEQDQAAFSMAEEQSRVAETHRAGMVSAFQARFEALELEMTEATQRRSQAVAAVTDQSLLKRYEGIRAKSGNLGIVRIEGMDCGGCHMTLPGSVTKSVKEGQQVETCENCGRLLAV
jgi:predicted  nucleic acid-binding Zn-ribbon protein